MTTRDHQEQKQLLCRRICTRSLRKSKKAFLFLYFYNITSGRVFTCCRLRGCCYYSVLRNKKRKRLSSRKVITIRCCTCDFLSSIAKVSSSSSSLVLSMNNCSLPHQELCKHTKFFLPSTPICTACLSAIQSNRYMCSSRRDDLEEEEDRELRWRIKCQVPTPPLLVLLMADGKCC